MMQPTLRHLRVVQEAYRACAAGVRLRVVGRYALCPFPKLLRLFPAHGRILDVGCGDGLLFALMAAESGAERTFTGIDIDARKVRNARRAQIPRATFVIGSLDQVRESYSAVAIVDALCLIPRDEWPVLLRRSIELLAPGGVLVIKDITNTPRWKYWIALIEEIIAVYVIRMTKGRAPHFEALDTFRHYIRDAGGAVLEVVDMSAWRPHAHVAFVVSRRT